MVRQFFIEIYTDDEPPFTPFMLPAIRFTWIMDAELHKLDGEIIDCKIKKAIFDMNPYKAPGLDRFKALFYQRFWELTGSKLTQLVLDVLSGRTLPDDLNDTFLVLILKVNYPQIVT